MWRVVRSIKKSHCKIHCSLDDRGFNFNSRERRFCYLIDFHEFKRKKRERSVLTLGSLCYPALWGMNERYPAKLSRNLNPNVGWMTCLLAVTCFSKGLKV